MSFNTLPKFDIPFINGRVNTKDWYFFLSGLFTGLPPGNVQAITVATSPFTYQATRRGFVLLSGGTVTLVQFTRDGITNYTTGATGGAFPLSASDRLIVTYTVAPTMVFVPQ